jgi:hypothetical protein
MLLLGTPNPNDRLPFKIARKYDFCGNDTTIYVGGNGEIDRSTNPPTVDISIGIGFQIKFGGNFERDSFQPSSSFDDISRINFSNLSGADPIIVPYTLGSLFEPSSTMSGLLTLFPSDTFNPVPNLFVFDPDGDGTYNFKNTLQFDNFLVTSVVCPEPFTIIGTLIGGTAAFRMRKKLKG